MVSQAPPSNPIDATLTQLRPVTLDGLNRNAAMLTRLNRKYILGRNALENLLLSVQDDFRVLEIGGRRSFLYDTTYFDDKDLSSYFEHHQGRRRRFKVRTRLYDTSDCFLEVKLKSLRGTTVKKRCPHPVDQHGVLNEDALRFIAQSHEELYDATLPDRALTPSLRLFYHRACLAAETGGERFTIDRDLSFQSGPSGRGNRPVSRDLYIIETKTRTGRGLIDDALRRNHQRPTRRCSKYCVGLNLTDQVQRNNRFLPALRQLVPQPD